MFNNFGDAFTAGVVGGFVSEAVEEEDESLRRLVEDYEDELEDFYPSNIRSSTKHCSIYDDSDPSENTTEIGELVERTMAFANKRLSSGRK